MPVRSEPVSLCFLRVQSTSKQRKDVIFVLMTRTTPRTKADESSYCGLVDHTNLELLELEPTYGVQDVNDKPEVATSEPDVDTKPLPVIMMYSDEQMTKLIAIENEVATMIARSLVAKRLLNRLFLAKRQQTIIVSVHGHMFEVVKDKVSCSATQALIANKSLLHEVLESAAKSACVKVAGTTFVRFVPYAPYPDSPRMTRSGSFELVVSFA